MSDSFLYTKLGKRESQKLTKDINLKMDGHAFAPDSATVMAAELSFYGEGWRIVEFSDHTDFPVVTRLAIQNPQGEMNLTDYTHNFVQSLNEAAPLKLTIDSADDYMRFYLDVVSGPKGKLYLIEAVDDMPWEEDVSPQLRKNLYELVQPLSVTELKDAYEGKATVLFKDALFSLVLTIDKKTGTVAFSDQDLLMEKLPVRDMTLGR